MSNRETKPLADYARETELLQSWFSTWETISQRILKLPLWMQAILLDDINTAIESRIAVMELILNAQRNS